MDLKDSCVSSNSSKTLSSVLDRGISTNPQIEEIPTDFETYEDKGSKIASTYPAPENSSVVTPFLVKHYNDQANIPRDNIHKFCYRHNPDIVCNKEADEKIMRTIQTELECLPSRDRMAISHVWLIFAAAPHAHRSLILKGLLSQCCFPQLLAINQQINQLIRIDFIATLPVEIALKILCYLDCKSLCNAAQVSRRWKELADDDRVWHHMCKQHIDRKCPNCGWGLPLMHMKRAREGIDERDCKRQKIEGSEVRKRPWKSVYSERFQLEKNWRNGVYLSSNFVGHTDTITCLKFNRKHLILGLYDATVKIWNIETGECIKTLSGHQKGVRALAFDSQKLITGGLDSTVKVWNYHNGECISTYRGHDDAVTSVDFCDKTIVSGSADCTVKVWHVDSRTCYTLRGHTDGVNCVKIHSPSNTVFSASDDTTVKMWDMKSNQCLQKFGGIGSNGHVGQVQAVIPFVYKGNDLVIDFDESDSEVQPRNDSSLRSGSNQSENCFSYDLSDNSNYPTHVLTSSLDNTIKLWDVKSGKCIRTQFGHIEGIWSIDADNFRIVSGAHDKLIKVWDLQDGKCLHTFGNKASVCCVALSSHRVAAGLESGNIKVYDFN